MKIKSIIILFFVIIVIIISNGFYWLCSDIQTKCVEKIANNQELSLYEQGSILTLHLGICTVGSFYCSEAAYAPSGGNACGQHQSAQNGDGARFAPPRSAPHPHEKRKFLLRFRYDGSEHQRHLGFSRQKVHSVLRSKGFHEVRDGYENTAFTNG